MPVKVRGNLAPGPVRFEKRATCTLEETTSLKLPLTWLETGFTWELTGDGSPTLRVNGGGESMHHSGGALAETNLIYGSAVREAFAFEAVSQPRLLSVGLGLGYVELMAAAASLRTAKRFEMWSLESVAPLVEAITAWVRGELPLGEIHAGLDEVARLVSELEGVPAAELISCLRRALIEERWRVGGVLSHVELPPGDYHGILYDVFAAKTYPDLWTEEHLTRFLSSCAATPCVFSTFACTGNLKRALRATGFDFVKRDGFMGTRNSTLGRRGGA